MGVTAMGVTKDRVTVLMALSIFLFGCKGAGGLVKAAVVVGYVAARVAVAAASASSHHSTPARDEATQEDPPPAARSDQAALPAGERLRCVAVDEELPVEQRTYVCGKHVIVRDPASGRWVEKH